ncbi:MAG: hypothetical protein ACM4AI_09890 [Acidobacteriota bacterium]
MRSRSLARVVIASLGVSVVITLGCGKPPSAPSPPPTPGLTQPRSDSQLAPLALFEAASLHWGVTTSPLTWATEEDGKVRWTNGPCDDPSQGSVQASLDGGVSPTSGTFLPTGSHTYVVSFSTCLVDGWAGTLNGVASAAYSAAEWSNVTATVSADSVRGRWLASFSELHDVTADGSAVWTRVGIGSSSTQTMTYTPAAGSRLFNNSTTNVATFGGGSYSMVRYPAKGTEQRFDNLKVAINGTEYTLNGSIDTTYGFNGSNIHTGEVRIINNGTLVARIYGDGGNDLRVEVLMPLVPF